jgi:aconitase A
LLRTEDGRNVKADDIRALAAWNSKSKPDKEIAFTPSRVLLQDFTGVPAVVDLAAMRDAMKRLSGDPTLINPLQPAELVIDHSVQVDEFGTRSLSSSTPNWNLFATKSATHSCAGDKMRFAIWRLCRRIPALCTR